jgi:excisionase family DNA binding protein
MQLNCLTYIVNAAILVLLGKGEGVNTQAIELTKLRYSRNEAAQLLGVSPRHLDNRILNGDLKVVRDGSRVFITLAQLRQYASRDHAGTNVLTGSTP